jgi:Na+-transporting NADH:ubiquinone oxidoreductase subunit C
MANDNKKGFNTNSNVYTIIYSTIMVVVVAFLLAFVYQVLKDRQDANVALDKKKQILYALDISGLSDVEAAAKYKEVVVRDEVISPDGSFELTKEGNENHGFKLNSADYKNGQLALFVCNVDGATKYVIPVYGMGLWGPISGFIAIDEDKQTVSGAYFNHESETAGLGAEIKDSKEWQDKFKGKKIFDASGAVGLGVVKNVSKPEMQVDAVTGATLTSNGVDEMLKEGLGKYVKFLKGNK